MMICIQCIGSIAMLSRPRSLVKTRTSGLIPTSIAIDLPRSGSDEVVLDRASLEQGLGLGVGKVGPVYILPTPQFLEHPLDVNASIEEKTKTRELRGRSVRDSVLGHVCVRRCPSTTDSSQELPRVAGRGSARRQRLGYSLWASVMRVGCNTKPSKTEQ